MSYEHFCQHSSSSKTVDDSLSDDYFRSKLRTARILSMLSLLAPLFHQKFIERLVKDREAWNGQTYVSIVFSSYIHINGDSNHVGFSTVVDLRSLLHCELFQTSCISFQVKNMGVGAILVILTIHNGYWFFSTRKQCD